MDPLWWDYIPFFDEDQPPSGFIQPSMCSLWLHKFISMLYVFPTITYMIHGQFLPRSEPLQSHRPAANICQEKLPGKLDKYRSSRCGTRCYGLANAPTATRFRKVVLMLDQRRGRCANIKQHWVNISCLYGNLTSARSPGKLGASSDCCLQDWDDGHPLI